MITYEEKHSSFPSHPHFTRKRFYFKFLIGSKQAGVYKPGELKFMSS